MYRKKRIFQLNLSGISPHLPFLIFCLVFIVGVLLGNLFVGKFEYFNGLAVKSFNDFYTARQGADWPMMIKNSFYNILPPYLIIFLLGTSIVGCVCAPSVLFILGIRFGLISGHLYITYKLNGIIFNCLILIPWQLIMLFGLILLTKEAFGFSKTLSGVCIRSNKPVNVYSSFKNYSIKSAITLIAAVISVIFDIGMSSLFMGYFTF